jgi:tRNA (guanine37-N1)-methyltransferase
VLSVDILTLFPGMVEPSLRGSILGRAEKSGLWSLKLHDIRAFGLGRHKSVDDTPYGGGSGMLMRADVVGGAIASVRRPASRVILLDAGGTRFTHAEAVRLASSEHLVLVCGHYEGIDARIREHLVDEVISIGDFVLTGGELAACVVTDAVVRLLPGALGDDHSSVDESFASGMLEYPQYTRPAVFEGHPVPEVLLSGNHAKSAAWRAEQARLRTSVVRPDLLASAGGPESQSAKPARRGRVRKNPD